ncbi:hypothetical protein HED50_19270 [Ochrobactrum oryzae]|nr:hypothetical protein [Brucella oryzae]
MLDMEFRNQGVYAYFRLTLTDKTAGVELNHIAFEDADEDPAKNTARLANAFDAARLPLKKSLKHFPQNCKAVCGK